MDNSVINDRQSLDNTTAQLQESALRCDGGTTMEKAKKKPADDDCHIAVQNLGGIDSLAADIPPGVTLLVGRNATNRTSLLRSLAAGLGGEQSAARLKTDCDSGSVELAIDGEKYTRTYNRNGQSVSTEGEPFTDDAEIVDTFVGLFADCPARVAVETDRNLRDVLMSPVDTSEIRAEITQLKRERESVEETIERAESRKQKLPSLTERRAELEAELHSVEENIAATESVVDEIEETADDSDASAELRSQLETLRSELSRAERKVDQTEQQRQFRQGERDDLREEREQVKTELAEFADADELEGTIDRLERELDQLSEQRQTLRQTVEDLHSVIQANESFLDADMETVGFVEDGTVTGALDPDSRQIECWTCGTSVERSQVTAQIETLREVVARHRTEMRDLEERLRELKQEKSSHEETLAEYEEMTHRLDELDSRIEQHTEKLAALEPKREEHEATIEELEAEISSVEEELENVETETTEETETFVDAHKELTQLERKRGRLETQLEGVRSEIEEIESLDEQRAQAQTQYDELTTELESLRGRIDQLEGNLVETLNEIMEDLVDRLEYKNLARVWVERRKSDRNSSFELHIVRESEDGAVYEDTVDTLSESEREVVGLVIALAGHLVHDVSEEVPFLLSDSVEMIDGERLAKLLQYMIEQTKIEYLTVALLPKDAQAVQSTGIVDRCQIIEFGS